MNWRTVHIHTPDKVLVVVPNSFLTNNVLTNLTEPSPHKEFELAFTFDFEVPSERVIRVLNAALTQTTELLTEPAAKTRVSRVNASGVEYKVKYWIDPRRCGPAKARALVTEHILQGLAQAGLMPSYPKSDVYTADLPIRNLDVREDRVSLLARIELFSVLSHEELESLADQMHERVIRRNEVIVRRGESGNSMYLLLEGYLNVCLPEPGSGREVPVAQLKPGAYFGEMSLLTGEPLRQPSRPSVTVCYSRSRRPAWTVCSRATPNCPTCCRSRLQKPGSRTSQRSQGGAKKTTPAPRRIL